jgi:parvulin-like peptidyl-prolyl isomerase
MAILVNGERIEDQAIYGESMRLQQGGAGPDAAKMAEQNVIDQVIMRQEATRRAYTVTPAEIEQGLHKLFVESGGKEAFMQRHRLTEADEPRLREHVVISRRVEKMIDDVCADIPAPTAEAVRAYFDEHPDEFVQPARVRASHIVKRPTSQDDEETFAAMCEARERVLAGEPFAELAAEYSDCSSEPGGDLGFFAKGHMVPGFEAVAFSMKPGEVSPVFVTQFGMHVMKVFEREDPRPLTFEEVEKDLAKRLHEDARDQAFSTYLEGLRKKADIQRADAPKPERKQAKKGKGKKGK